MSRIVLALAAATLALVLAGCGGSARPSPAITITVTHTETVTTPASPSASSATLSWMCAITAAESVASNLWQVSFMLTATNGSGQPADITNGAAVTFTDEAGDATDTYPVSWAQVIQPGSSASFTATEHITAPSSSAPASCQVAQWE